MANQDLWTRQVALFKSLSDSTFQPLAYRAKLMHQSLARIDHDKDPAWKENCMRGYKLLNGLITIASSLQSADLSGAAGGVLTVLEGTKTTDIAKKEWYAHIIMLEAKLGDAVTSPDNFIIFKNSLSLVIQHAKREIDLSYGIFELVQRIVLNSSIESGIRCLAIELLQNMYIQKETWHADISFLKRQGKGNGDDQLRMEVLRTLAALTNARNQIVRTNAVGALKSLYASFQHKGKGAGYTLINNFMPNGVYPTNSVESTGLLNLLTQIDILRIPLSNQLLGEFASLTPKGSLSPAIGSESTSDSPEESPASPTEAGEKKQTPIDQVRMLQSIPQMTLNTIQRNTHMESIEARFQREATAGRKPIVVLQGMPGIGKTQLAINYINQHKKEKLFIFWIDAKALDTEWIAFGEILLRSTELLVAQPKDRQLQTIREELASYTNWTIVFDQLENEEALEGLLPDNLNSEQQVLITTRSPDWQGYCSILLKPFTSDEAEQYFQTIADGGSGYQKGGEELAKELEYIPLALYYAFSYMNLYHVSAEVFKKDYSEKQGIKLLSVIKPNKAARAHYHTTIPATYEMILQQINSHSKDANDLLILCSYINHQKIETRFLKKILGWPDDKLNANIMIIRPHHVLSIIDQSDLQMYRFTQAAIRHCHANQLSAPHALKSYIKNITNHFCRLYPLDKTNKEAFAKAHLLIPHIEKFITHIIHLANEKDDKHDSISVYLTKLYTIIFDYHRTVTGNHENANMAARRIYYIRSTISDFSDPEAIDACNQIGVTYNELGNLEQSLIHHNEALHICNTIHGSGYNSVSAECHIYLGNTHYHAHNFAQSTAEYEKALHIYGKCKNINAALVANCQTYLARTKATNPSTTQDAIELCAKALFFYNKTKNNDENATIAEVNTHLSTAYSLLFLTSQNKIHKDLAIKYNNEALKIRLNIYGSTTHWVAESYMQLAGIELASNQLNAALTSCHIALQIYLAEYQGKPYLCVAECHKQLALIYQQLHQPEEEREQLEKIITIYVYFNKQHEITALQKRIDTLPAKKQEKPDNYLHRMNSHGSYGELKGLFSPIAIAMSPPISGLNRQRSLSGTTPSPELRDMRRVDENKSMASPTLHAITSPSPLSRPRRVGTLTASLPPLGSPAITGLFATTAHTTTSISSTTSTSTPSYATVLSHARKPGRTSDSSV